MAGAIEARCGQEPRRIQLDKAAGCTRVHVIRVQLTGEKSTHQWPQLFRRIQICCKFMALYKYILLFRFLESPAVQLNNNF